MKFAEYRELLRHIHVSHHPMKKRGHPDWRTVINISCTTDMRESKVTSISMNGYGWNQTLEGDNLMARCLAILDGQPLEDQPKPVIERRQTNVHATAVQALQAIITGELGRNTMELAEAFSVKDIKMTIPADVLQRAIEEIDGKQTASD